MSAVGVLARLLDGELRVAESLAGGAREETPDDGRAASVAHAKAVTGASTAKPDSWSLKEASPVFRPVEVAKGSSWGTRVFGLWQQLASN